MSEKQLVADMTKPTEYVVELATADGDWEVSTVHADAASAIAEAARHYPTKARAQGIPNIWSMVRLRNVGAA